MRPFFTKRGKKVGIAARVGWHKTEKINLGLETYYEIFPLLKYPLNIEVSLVIISFCECNFMLHWIRREYPCGCWECTFGNNVNSSFFLTALTATGECPQLVSGLQIKAVFVQLSSCFLRFLVSYHMLSEHLWRNQHLWSSCVLEEKFIESYSTKLQLYLIFALLYTGLLIAIFHNLITLQCYSIMLF